MSILRTVATFALGYAAARGVDRLRRGPEPKGQDTRWNATKGEAWMKARADKFRDQHTTPRGPGGPA